MKFEQFKMLAVGAALAVGLSVTGGAKAQTNGLNTEALNKLDQLTTSMSTPFAVSKSDIQKTKAPVQQKIIIDENKVFENLNAGELAQVQMDLMKKFDKQLEKYQQAGLYSNLVYANVIPLFESNGSQAETNTVLLHIDKKSTMNNLILKDELKFSFEKVLMHELAHVQFNQMPTLLDNDTVQNQIINAQINSNLYLETVGLGENTSRKFVQENIADTYAELAYMKLNNFNDESIAQLKEDLKLRMADAQKINELGKNLDSHDTCASLQALVDIVSDPKLKENLRILPGQYFDDLSKAVVLNTYKDYMEKDDIKTAIETNIQNGHVSKTNVMLYKEMKLPEKMDLKAKISTIREIFNPTTSPVNKVAKLN